jgi:hypothetical protein
MRKRTRAALAPAAIAAAVAGAAGHRAQDSGSGRRLDVLGRERPAERFDQVWAGGAGSSHWGC